MSTRITRTLHPLSITLLALCLLLELLFIRQYSSITTTLHVYDALGAGRSGLVALIAGVGPILPLVLMLIAGALITKEFWIRDPNRTVLINAVAAAVLLILPFVMLTFINGAVQNIIHQMGR